MLEPYGLAVTVKALKPAKVGTRRFAEGPTITVPNAVPLSVVDEQFTDRRYVLHVDVAAGSLSVAAHLAGKLARTLDHRLRLAEAGRLRGKPVKVPANLHAGAFTSGALTGVPGQFTQVDVSGAVALSSGRAADLVLVAGQTPLQSSDVLNLAQITANRLDTGLAG